MLNKTHGVANNPLTDTPYFQQNNLQPSFNPVGPYNFLLLTGENFDLLSGEEFDLLGP